MIQVRLQKKLALCAVAAVFLHSLTKSSIYEAIHLEKRKVFLSFSLITCTIMVKPNTASRKSKKLLWEVFEFNSSQFGVFQRTICALKEMQHGLGVITSGIEHLICWNEITPFLDLLGMAIHNYLSHLYFHFMVYMNI